MNLKGKKYLFCFFVLLVAFLGLYLASTSRIRSDFRSLYAGHFEAFNSQNISIELKLLDKTIIQLFDSNNEADILLLNRLFSQWGSMPGVTILIISNNLQYFTNNKDIELSNNAFLYLDLKSSFFTGLRNRYPYSSIFLVDESGNIAFADSAAADFRQSLNLRIKRFLHEAPNSLLSFLPIKGNIRDISWLKDLTPLIEYSNPNNYLLSFFRTACNSCPEADIINKLKLSYSINLKTPIIILLNSYNNVDIINFEKEFKTGLKIILADRDINDFFERQLFDFFINELNSIILEVSPNGEIVKSADILRNNYKNIFGPIVPGGGV